MSYTVRRGEWFYFNRRVPSAIAHLDDRALIQVSLKTRCPDTAKYRAASLNDFIEQYWADLIETGPDTRKDRFRRAVKLAKLYGFRYRTAAQIAKEDIESISARLHAVRQSGNDRNTVEALLGMSQAPSLQLSECLPTLWEHSRPFTISKNEYQIRKWREVRASAVRTFIDVVGDKPVNAVSRQDILDYRSWWMDRIEQEGIAASTVNKMVSQYLRGVLQTLATYEPGIDIDVAALFADIRIPERARQRPSFSDRFISETLLNPGKVGAMDLDGQLLICALADTGARPREIITRRAEDIILDAGVPHIRIRPREGELGKTHQSARDIPLVGAALFAFKQRPSGFTRYGPDQVDSFTSRVNKFLRENRLLESEAHSLYSLRHSFQDRLIAHEVGERMQCELMGHKFASRAKYGAGPTLEHKHRVLAKMAFQPLSAKRAD